MTLLLRSSISFLNEFHVYSYRLLPDCFAGISCALSVAIHLRIVRDDILGLIREFTEDEKHTVLISSHITSDLDKIADYIAYIHQGKLQFLKSYEEINENYGIINGGESLLKSLNTEDIIAYIKQPYSCSILINNRQDILNIFTDLDIKRPTVEKLMLFYVKGVK